MQTNNKKKKKKANKQKEKSFFLSLKISFILAINVSDKFQYPHTVVVATKNVKIPLSVMVSVLAGNYKSSAGNFKTVENFKIKLLMVSAKFQLTM